MTEKVAEQRGVLRAAVLATVTTVLTAVGHLAGGGSLPDITVLVVLLPLLAGVVSTLAECLRSTAGTLAVLGTGQLALHHLIELLNPSHAAHHLAGPGASSGTMLATHAGATLLTAAALSHADRAITVVGAVLGRVLPRRPAVLCADRPLVTPVTPGTPVSLRLARALAAAQVRRGPPVGC